MHVDHTHPDAVYTAYVGTDRDHCEVPMGGWLGNDWVAFIDAVVAQHVADIGAPPTFLVVLDAEGNDVHTQFGA